MQAGGSEKVVGVTWQLRLTVPVKPPTVTMADEVPSGGTATGENAEASTVRVCADAETGKLKSAASRQRTATLACAPGRMNAGFDGWDGDGSDFISGVVCDFEVSDFNMSRFWFK
jgi:hypothetical protein